jgi:hypothetical protein
LVSLSCLQDFVSLRTGSPALFFSFLVFSLSLTPRPARCPLYIYSGGPLPFGGRSFPFSSPCIRPSLRSIQRLRISTLHRSALGLATLFGPRHTHTHTHISLLSSSPNLPRCLHLFARLSCRSESNCERPDYPSPAISHLRPPILCRILVALKIRHLTEAGALKTWLSPG